MTTKLTPADAISGKVKISGGELYFQSLGTGEPVILIHAGFTDHRDWQHQISDFGKRHKVIAYDQRGSGFSSVPSTAFTPADDLKALMDHLNISKATLIGHSIGGTIALDFALQYPERVSALVLVASGLNGHAWSPEFQVWMQGIWGNLDPDQMTKQVVAAPFYTLAMKEEKVKSEIETITKENLCKVLTWETFNIHDIKWFYPEPKLEELKMPVLVVYGDKDSQDIKQIAHILGSSIPNAKMVQIENVDHFPNFEKPNEFNEIILNFLKSI